MIARLFRSNLNLCVFSFATVRKIGREVVADLPRASLPTKPKPVEDERLSTNLAYETFPYLKKDKLPNCRYFAVEYKNRIYHFFNAYYYPLGRMCNKVACAIRGKNSPHFKSYTADVNNGDVCVIVNIEDPLVTGKKLLFKKLRYHTGFVGHLKEYSYKHVLNYKPQLLYHHLLRKVMPKNKLSQKYMDNLVLCRGPTHSLTNFPQFAPDKKIYQYLPETDLFQLVKNDPSFRIAKQSTPGLAEQTFGRKVDKFQDDATRQQQRRESNQNVEDLSKIYQEPPKYKTMPDISREKYETMKRREKKIEGRYTPVRAPYKQKSRGTEGLQFYRSEKKARKDPNYQLLKNEDLQEVEEENKTTNPHVMGGAAQPPKNK